MIARQLIQSGKLDSFGLPMANLALSSSLVLLEALQNICQPRPVNTNLRTALRNISAALSLAGSSGLISNWVLNQQAGDTGAAGVKSLIVPVTFANSAIIKLLANSEALPTKALPYTKCIALTGMLLGSALFAELALTQRKDIPLFAVSCALAAGLLPQTLMAVKDIFRAPPRETEQTCVNVEQLETPNDTHHTNLTYITDH